MDITLNDLANLENEATATAAINANNATLEAAFDEVLTTTGPNVLSANVDMNTHRITNLPAASNATEPVRKAEFDAADIGAYTAALGLMNTALSASAVATAAALAAAAQTVGDGTITAAKLASNAVTTVKITDANVTTAKIADANVTTDKIADANVTTAKILDDNVTNTKLADMVTSTVKGNLSGSTANPTDVTIAALAAALVATGLLAATPPGAVTAYGASTVPTGWLECNGAAVSRTTYADLFTILSTTWGSGDGTTTFNVPDLRGEFIRGWDNSKGTDSGRTFASSQTDEFEAHTHTKLMYNTGGGVGSTTFPALAGALSGNTNTMTTSSTGSTETRPRNYALMYIVKT